MRFFSRLEKGKRDIMNKAISIFMVVVLLGVQSIAMVAQTNNENHKKGGDQWNATTPSEYVCAYRKLFDQEMSEELNECIAHPDNNIALAAAWERLRRSSHLENSKKVDVPTSDAISRYLGIVEGRIRVQIPSSWEKSMRSMRWNNFNNPIFDSQSDAYSSIVGEIPINKDCWIVTAENHKWSFPVETNIGWVDHVKVATTNAMAYVAIYKWPPESYLLYAVEKDTDKVVWSTKVWGEGNLRGGWLGNGWHNVDLQVCDQTIVVFGISEDVGYIESFDIKTGENLYRFSTSYFRAKGEVTK